MKTLIAYTHNPRTQGHALILTGWLVVVAIILTIGI